MLWENTALKGKLTEVAAIQVGKQRRLCSREGCGIFQIGPVARPEDGDGVCVCLEDSGNTVKIVAMKQVKSRHL